VAAAVVDIANHAAAYQLAHSTPNLLVGLCLVQVQTSFAK